ncbi:hypothetical protein T05_10451 [Trichinella murrelli]|uniref:Uncharacterized protein n=1 Tax=Trichinella murrelli TaxID=144512 RepID=A0A0V0T7B9_9BILA|nr:hypothetical protein T05_10451 [Trichinella murrelli]
MAGCFSSAPDAEPSGFVQAGAQRAQVTPGGNVSTRPQLVDLFSEALSLGDPHPGLLGCIQLLDSQGTPPALSSGGSAVPRKAEAKCGDPEQPLDVAISSGVENVILGVRHYRNQQSRLGGSSFFGRASLPPARRAILAPATNGCCLPVPSKTIRGSVSRPGCSSPGNLQHAGSTSRWISSTRLRANGFHRLSADRTHASVTSLSLQQNRERTSSCNALWVKWISLAAVRAPINSNLGSLRRFTGETQVFAATKLT